MKVFVVYGSRSDQKSFDKITRGLEQNGIEVDFAILSAHRNPDELFFALKNKDYHVVIAGAGVAAALPGVVAAKTKFPVFGVPVDSYFAGLDALASIIQMPYGVPVLTCGPNMEGAIIDFLANPKLKFLLNSNRVNVIVAKNIEHELYVQKELNRLKDLLKELNCELVLASVADRDSWNIILVTEKSMVLNHEYTAIYVPLVDDIEKNDPQKMIEILSWTKIGGMWVAANNSRNALLAINKLKQLEGVL